VCQRDPGPGSDRAFLTYNMRWWIALSLLAVLGPWLLLYVAVRLAAMLRTNTHHSHLLPPQHLR
jgi:hypothetical protein